MNEQSAEPGTVGIECIVRDCTCLQHCIAFTLLHPRFKTIYEAWTFLTPKRLSRWVPTEDKSGEDPGRSMIWLEVAEWGSAGESLHIQFWGGGLHLVTFSFHPPGLLLPAFTSLSSGFNCPISVAVVSLAIAALPPPCCSGGLVLNHSPVEVLGEIQQRSPSDTKFNNNIFPTKWSLHFSQILDPSLPVSQCTHLVPWLRLASA
ncbi:hypothetical protein K439DRAFT_1622640 [Ramaria rubella]|nr:hypothetical protein K439DRAFT_1622640 [Ramaria rubella]